MIQDLKRVANKSFAAKIKQVVILKFYEKLTFLTHKNYNKDRKIIIQFFYQSFQIKIVYTHSTLFIYAIVFF